MNETHTYTQAYEELLSLVHDMENGEISVDELSIKIKRAVGLIRVCRAKLTATEEEVQSILSHLNNAEEGMD